MSDNKMTPTPWEIDGYNMTAIIHNMQPEANHPAWKHVASCDYGYATPDDFVDLNMANAKAIVSAVNGTYGKNINPEAVADLLDVLEKIVAIATDRWRPLPATSHEKNCLSSARAAIKLAKSLINE